MRSLIVCLSLIPFANTLVDAIEVNSSYETLLQWVTYYEDMIKLKNSDSYQDFFCLDVNRSECLEFQGPGSDSTSFVSWDGVADILSNGPADIETGEIKDRGNELGLLRLNRIFWPECAENDPLTGEPIQDGSDMGGSECGIGLSVDKASHAFYRPMLDEVFGTPAGEINGAGELSEDSRYIGHVGEFVQNGNRWTKTELKELAKEWLASRSNFTSSTDMKKWVAQVLHYYGVGISLTEEEADEFVEFQSSVLIMSVLPEDVAWALKEKLEIPDILNQKESYIERYMEALNNTEIAEKWNDAELRYAAGALLESFLFAGGLSVPSIIQSSLGAYYKWDLRSSGLDPSTYPDNGKLIMESTRYNPPVVGWPVIRKDENGVEHRDIGIVAMAGFDASKYGNDVDIFNVTRFDDVSKWHQLSQNWADHGIHPNRTMSYSNRVCPGKDLSYAMIAAFLEEMDPKNWTVEALPEEESGPKWWTEFTMTRTVVLDVEDSGSESESRGRSIINTATISAASIGVVGGLTILGGGMLAYKKMTASASPIPMDESTNPISVQDTNNRL